MLKVTPMGTTDKNHYRKYIKGNEEEISAFHNKN